MTAVQRSPSAETARARPRPRDLDAYFLPMVETGNPYQVLLARGLESAGVHVEPKGRIGAKLAGKVAQRLPRPQVLHLHWVNSYLVRGSLAGSVAATCRFLSAVRRLRRLGVRVVWTVHGLVRHESKQRAWERIALALLVRSVDRAIAHTEGAARETGRVLRCPAQRLAVVPHGHYAGWYKNAVSREEARDRLGVPRDATAFLFFGRLREFKGVRELLDAFARLRDEGAVLLIAGEPWSADLARLIERRAAGDARVRAHLGFVPDDDVQIYMNAADAAVLPLRAGVTSGSAVLAMSFGKALVAARAPSLEGLPADGGAIAFDARRPDGLGRALEVALEADLRAMGARNRERALEWDWERVARLTRDVYDGSMVRAGPAGRMAT